MNNKLDIREINILVNVFDIALASNHIFINDNHEEIIKLLQKLIAERAKGQEMLCLIIDEELFTKIASFGQTRSIADATGIVDEFRRIILNGNAIDTFKDK